MCVCVHTVHGSTQMSITSGEGAEFASTLGVERVVVGRELSIKEIAKVRYAHTHTHTVVGRELSTKEIAKVSDGGLHSVGSVPEACT